MNPLAAFAERFRAELPHLPVLAGFLGADLEPGPLGPLGPAAAEEAVSRFESLAASAPEEEARLLRAQCELFRFLIEQERWRDAPDVTSELSALLLRQALDASNNAREQARLEGWCAGLDETLRSLREGRRGGHPLALRKACEAFLGFTEQVGALPLPPALRADVDRALGLHGTWLDGLSQREVTAPGPEFVARLLALRHAPVDGSQADAPLDLPAVAGMEVEGIEGLLGALASAWRAEGLPESHGRVQLMPVPPSLAGTVPSGAVFTPRPLRPEEPALVLVPPGRDLLDDGFALFLSHEAHPGHLLQAERARAAGRWWREVDLCPLVGHGAGLWAAEAMEGWAHFIEGRVVASPFGNPGRREAALRMRTWRDLRAELDLALALGRCEVGEAISRFEREGGMELEEATGEVAELLANPTYGLSYRLGRRWLEARCPRGPGEAAFIERFLGEGLVPLGMRAEPGAP